MSTTAQSVNPVDTKVREAQHRPVSPELGLSVYVVFTSIPWTLKALQKAREMAEPLGAKVVVVAAQAVPYPLPLDRPPVPMEFVVRRFEEMAGISHGKIHLAAYLCRDLFEALKSILNPHSPVVMGTKGRWLPNREERLARKLRRSGYDVILVRSE